MGEFAHLLPLQLDLVIVIEGGRGEEMTKGGRKEGEQGGGGRCVGLRRGRGSVPGGRDAESEMVG